MSPTDAPLAVTLARRARALRGTPLPDPVVRAAQDHLLDAIGVGLAGGAAASGPLGGDLSRLGAGAATVLGRAERLTPAHAALLNGTFVHAMEYDDTHVPSVIHGSAVVAPAVLASAERDQASGADALLAFAAAWETLILLGLAAPGAFQAAGFQTVAVAGPFGAALAAGLLADLPEDRLVDALGICGSQAGGTFAFLQSGATVKAMHAGWAAQSGIVAADMAALGVSGPATVFEGPFGFFRQFAHDPDAAARFGARLEGFGADWSLPEAAFKLYPCCHYIHPFLEAVELLRADGLTAADVHAVVCHVPTGAAPIVCDPWDRKLRPASGHEARYSLPICVAAVLLRGRLRPEDVAGLADDAEVLALASRISWRPWEDSGFPQRFPARIEIERTDGDRDEVCVPDVRGSADRPVLRADVQAKFRDNATPVVGAERAAAIVAAVEALPDAPDVRALTDLLGAPAA